MAETIEELVRETNAKIVTDNGFKLAMDPKVTMPESEGEIEGVIAGKADLSYTVALEVVPPIELADFQVDQAGEARHRGERGRDPGGAAARSPTRTSPIRAKGEGAKVEKGDRVIDHRSPARSTASRSRAASGEDIGVNVGSGTFIPGFEDQLIGMAAGETRTVNVTFPTNYLAEQLAGKDAVVRGRRRSRSRRRER